MGVISVRYHREALEVFCDNCGWQILPGEFQGHYRNGDAVYTLCHDCFNPGVAGKIDNDDDEEGEEADR